MKWNAGCELWNDHDKGTQVEWKVSLGTRKWNGREHK